MCVRTLIDHSPLILLHHGTGPYCVISCLNISAHLLFKALTLVFALSGIFIGAVTGALADSTVNGVFRRIVLGAIVGAVAFVETLKSWQVDWNLEQSQSDSPRFVRGFFHDLISGRMVHEFLIPAVSGAHQWQINIREMTYEDIFDALIPLSTGYAVAGGAPLELLNGLPKHAISQAEEFDSNGEPQSCSICLQDFQRGETARSLPKCSHTFHLGCVDQWLVKHGLCPLCRQYV